MNIDQQTLFACQKYHLRRRQELQRELHDKARLHSKRALTTLRRRIRRHDKFVQAITPFVRLPLPVGTLSPASPSPQGEARASL